jgi:hypothetical protein
MVERDRTIRPLASRHVETEEWLETRFPGVRVKVMHFRDGVACVYDRFDPGARLFAHQHGFRQLRYVLEGEFIVNGVAYGPGSMIDFPEFTEYESSSPKGGLWLLIQMPGSTGITPTDPTGFAYNALLHSREVD